VPAVLEKYHRHAKAAEDHAGENGPEENDGFAALFPRRLPVKKHPAQQVDRGIFRFDNYSIGPIPRKSMRK